ncbi:MAG: hypothetical protein V4864_08010 [Pseudomonadota bacterium]
MPLDDPRIGAAQAERCVDAYIAAWNEPEADQRTQLLAQVMHHRACRFNWRVA